MFINAILWLGAFANSLSISAAEAFLAVIILISVYRTFRTRDYTIFKKGFFIFYLLMIVAETISTFSGVNPEKALRHYTDFWVLLYLPALYVAFEGHGKRNWLLALFAGGVVASVYGILTAGDARLGRAVGFFTHALTFGNVMALVAVTSAGFLMFRLFQNRYHILAAGITLFLSTWALVLSGSRGPILALIIVLCAMAVYKMRMKGVVAAVVIMIIMTAVVAKVPSVNYRFINTVKNMTKTDSSIGTRLILWEAASEAIMARPFFGYGKGSFKSEVSKYIDVPTLSRAHAHNAYIQYTFLHGFFGLFALLGFLGSLLWEILGRMRTSSYAKIALFVMLVFLLEGLTENNLSDSEVSMMCFSIVGLALAPGRRAIRHREELSTPE